MRTREEQIDSVYRVHNHYSTITQEAFRNHIEEAEHRAEQRVRAEIAHDSERLDWLGGNVTLSARYFLRGGWAVMHLDEALGHGETLRQAIDAAREVE
jgi:hypothetical protein